MSARIMPVGAGYKQSSYLLHFLKLEVIKNHTGLREGWFTK